MTAQVNRWHWAQLRPRTLEEIVVATNERMRRLDQVLNDGVVYDDRATTFSQAVSGSFYDRGGAVFNVKHPDFGAKGDGLVNDTPAFVKAILAAKAVAGAVVVPPNSNVGTPYLLGPAGAMTATALLNLNGRVSLLGLGGGDAPTLKLANGSNRSLIEIEELSQGNRIGHLRLEGNKANQVGTSHGLRLRNVTPIPYQDSRYLFNNLLIQDFLTNGVLSEAGASEVRMLWVIVRSCGAHGFEIGGSDTRLIECESGFNGAKGLYMTQGFNHVRGGGYFLNGSYNIHVAASAEGAWITECDLDRAQFDNVKIDADDTLLMACISRDPGQAATLVHSHVNIAAGLSGVVVMGNRFRGKSLANQAVYCIRANGALANSVTGPNSYDATSFGVDRVLQAGAPGPDYFYGRPRRSRTLAYGAVVNTDATLGDDFSIVVTDANPFTIALPTFLPVAPDVQHVTYDIVNNSGGAMGAITWPGNFLLAGAFTNPANNKRRTITFKAQGVTLVELSRAAADI